MKKTIGILIVAVLFIGMAFWVKGYYNNVYVGSATYYTQVPLDEINKDSCLVDAQGNILKDVPGKEYELVGYDDGGNKREIYFVKRGTAADYYAPGTYIKVNTSKTRTLSEEIVDEDHVPKKALEKIAQQGTRI